MKINISKILVIALLIVLAAFAALTYTSERYISGVKPNAVSQTTNDSAGTIDKIFAAPGNFLRDKFTEIKGLTTTYQQNEALKKKLSKASDNSAKLADALQENKELKAALGLKNSLSNYTTLEANVITRTPSSWNDTLTIDKGAKNGLTSGMIVMANGGIIGRVSQTSDLTAKVSFMSGKAGLKNPLPVQIGMSNTPSYGLLTKFDSKTSEYVVSQINSTESFKLGEKVVTSGLSGVAPSNLTVGTVVGQKGASSDASREIFVKPAAKSTSTHFVTVVERGLAQ